MSSPANDNSTIQKTQAIISPGLDFWLLGGFSIVVWLLMIVANPFRTHDYTVENHFSNIVPLFATLSLVVNYPHFIVSYKLAYQRGKPFILKHWFCLIAVPLTLIAVFFGAYHALHYIPTPGSAVLEKINLMIASTGLVYRLGQMPTWGHEVFGWALLLMYLSVGWHYSKQIFGCMMVYSRYDEYSISNRQRNFLKANLFSLWGLNFLRSQTRFEGMSPGAGDYFGVQFVFIGLPEVLYWVTSAFSLVSLGWVLYFVFYKNWKEKNLIPSLTMIIPWIAFHLWWAPVFDQSEFSLYAVPFFHSLQYLAFVHKIEKNPNPTPSKLNPGWKDATKIITILLIGILAFELIPGLLDRSYRTKDTLEVWYFLASAALVINIHHYFIDSVIWKLGDPEIRKKLLTN
jgi:hypothetical protein